VCNVDDILTHHADFLNSCLKDCMLTSPDLLKIVHKLMMVCVMFSNFMQVTSRALAVCIVSAVCCCQQLRDRFSLDYNTVQ